ncbi:MULTISPECIES: dihydrolipoamide acetyltransferase family protein [unclassified Sphingomonas]|uniref:dihydrolipoamide acetyltransferase family protein n=1 Tax=unclassified Sphingomonas TaxID=196159 RepID=UPI0006F392C2|nr:MULTISPECIES: dihydrolipoamide acetyltransferase family protein [unclassified Sphingomonas]KQX19139.1 branched-chain alpha-keto acid dehydrogenase subunit E2 [Sphingomonas sp. Root1294]KQY65340.1 branched-chain alpha-keto acid dehydrogenase subunit E2 [Sphingomonas sp. Root50]KRB95365.1 branched-chain alpha-keto acid dehydrogenase subunit E2 [Sphingomonas sp. Root720]
MESFNFKLPDIGEGIAEAEIVAWHVAIGDVVEEDAPLADLMTDKATVEMTAPVGGKIVQLAGEVGESVAIGSILAVFAVESSAPDAPVPALTVKDSRQAAFIPAREPDAQEGPARGEEGREASVCPPAETQQPLPLPHPPARILASPAVRQRAKNLGVELAQVKTVEGGRVRHADLDAFLSYNAGGGYRPAGGARPDKQIKVIGMRRRIAENMAASKRHIPHFTYVEEIDVTKLEELRADLNATRGAKPKITMLPLLILAICKTLPDFPMINARYDDEAGIVTRSGTVHLGMATQTDAGLMVPVIRNAESRNIWQLATEIVRLADAARTGKAKSEELSGSTLTITSLGPLGGIATTPVINRPEVAIIGPNKVVERPVFRDGMVVVAKLMNLSISCDHRVVDGWDAASYVQALKRLIETPALLFFD